MMAKNGEKESCEVAHNLAALDGRVGKLETRMDKIEGSISVGFSQVNTAIGNLAQQFGERMNIIEKKVVDEKAKHDERIDTNRAKWHDTLRKIALIVTYSLVTAALIAVGINVARQFFPSAS